MAIRRKIKVVYRKLGKEKAWGQCHDDCIEIDPRLRGKKKFEVYQHECLHSVFPEKSEEEITKAAIIITNTIWSQGIAWIDRDNSEPMQDGRL